MRAIALIAGFLFLASMSSASAEDAKKASAVEPGSGVTMPYLIAPLSSDGNLLGYAYISCKIVGASPAAALEITAKVPFIQDALVRDVNATSVAKPDDPGAIDQTVLAARMLAIARKVMGPGKVADLKLTQVQITPLRPGTIPGASPS